MAVVVRHSGGHVTLSDDTRSVKFDARNQELVRSVLLGFVATGWVMRIEEAAHGETLVIKGGGTDAAPKVWISSKAQDGTSLGSLWVSVADAREVLRTL
jgi:hypothetical protein